MAGISNFAKAITLCTALIASSARAADRHPATGDILADDQTFTYRLLEDPGSLDPQLIDDTAGADIARDLFEGLLNQDAEGNLVPGVALGFSTNAAKSVYTFYLRDNARWSNGDPVTAEDFVYSWRRAVDPETAAPYAWFMELTDIENVSDIVAGALPPSALGVRALDLWTLEVRLAGSLRHFPKMLTHPTMFPVHRPSLERYGTGWTQPENIVSNGAFVLREYSAGQRLIRTRNPQYWNNPATLLDRVVARVIPDDERAFLEYIKGRLDRTEIPNGMMPALMRKMPGDVAAFPRLCSYYYNINVTASAHPALRDARVRQALSLSIDRDDIVGRVLQGGQFPAYTFTPETTADFTPPRIEMATLTQSERNARARALMAEAGYADGFEVSLTYNTSQAHRNIAEAISAIWRETLNIRINLVQQEWRTFLETRGRKAYDIARAGWCGDYNEASTFLDLVRSDSGYNDAGYTSPEVDALMDRSRTSDDPAPLYSEVERLIARDVPIIPIYHYSAVYLLDPSVGNWPRENVEQAWYSRDLYKRAVE